MYKRQRTPIILVLAMLYFFFTVQLSVSAELSAADIIVNSTADPGNGICDATECTLHEAIVLANAHPDPNKIIFRLSTPSATISLNEALPILITSLTMYTAFPDTVIISGNHQWRVLDIAEGMSVRLQGMVIADGVALPIEGQPEQQRGGGIRNAGRLTLDKTVVRDNQASDGGGIYNTGLLVINNGTRLSGNQADDGAGAGNGGGIYNTYKVVISRSTIGGFEGTMGNRAHGQGGALFNAPGGWVQVNKEAAFTYNQALDGGAIANSRQGTITIDSTNFGHNGGIWETWQQRGGAIWNEQGGTMHITRSTFVYNMAQFTGGSIYNDGLLTLTQCTFDGNQALDVGGAIYNSGQLQMHHCSLSNSDTWNYGGTIGNYGTLTIEDSTLAGSYSWDGGAIHNGGRLDVTNSTFTDNFGTFGGGAISNYGVLNVTDSTFSQNGGDNGAAILNRNQTDISSSTFVSNQAYVMGGAIANLTGSLAITNSTFTGNTAVGLYDNDGMGGALYNEGNMTVTHSTFHENVAERGGGLFILDAPYGRGTLQLVGSIVANNEANSLEGDCAGPVSSLGHNLDTDGSCSLHAVGDGTADPLLGPLQDNGGPTETFALLAGSPAIDRIQPTMCLVTDDQRGIPRPQGPACDSGAFEYKP